MRLSARKELTTERETKPIGLVNHGSNRSRTGGEE
jgi:hypothetical protein